MKLILWNTVIVGWSSHGEGLRIRRAYYWRVVFTMWLGEMYWKPARPPMEAVSMEILEIRRK